MPLHLPITGKRTILNLTDLMQSAGRKVLNPRSRLMLRLVCSHLEPSSQHCHYGYPPTTSITLAERKR